VGDITFTPDFHHTEWVDGTDRVRAEEPNGFNGRFATIESDLQRLSTVVDEIDTALDQLDAVPPPVPVLHAVSPALLFFGSGRSWNVLSDGRVTGSFGVVTPNIRGVADLVLPDGVRLISFRAAGQTSGASIDVTLFRVPYGNPGAAANLAVVSTGATAFDETRTIDTVLGRIDTATFRYAIKAVGSPIGGSGSLTVTTLDLVHIAD
jgi:hypothetical protein